MYVYVHVYVYVCVDVHVDVDVYMAWNVFVAGVNPDPTAKADKWLSLWVVKDTKQEPTTAFNRGIWPWYMRYEYEFCLWVMNMMIIHKQDVAISWYHCNLGSKPT